MSLYKLPPHEFTKIIHKIYGDDYDFSNWEESDEYRIFRAGRMCELQYTVANLEKSIKYFDNDLKL